MTNRVMSERDARFANRQEAGRRLAERLLPLAPEHPVIVALPRGVGERYRDFSQVSDEEVMAVLEEFGDAAV